MQIQLIGNKIKYLGSKTLGYEKNNLVDELIVTVDTDQSWSYKVWIKKRGHCRCGQEIDIDVFNLTRVGNVCSLSLSSQFLDKCGKYTMQLEGTDGTKVRHSDLFYGWVLHTINAN